MKRKKPQKAAKEGRKVTKCLPNVLPSLPGLRNLGKQSKMKGLRND
jgi:hypothetical protein